MAQLGVRNLTKLYARDPPAGVDGLTHDFAANRVTAILGPSGCGKTTLLMLVAGLLRPDRGGVSLDGRDVTALPPERRGVGVVFQNYALFPHLSVRGNVEFGLRRLGRIERRRRAGEVLDRLGLAALAERPVGRVSGGEQQRVAVARALARRPGVLLLDEPLSALDATLRGRLRDELLSAVREAGVTALYVTHDQREALEVGDAVAVMNAGRFEQAGPPREVYGRPATRFVAEFVGGGAVIDGACVEAPGGRIVRLGFTSFAAPADLPPGPCQIVLRAESLAAAADGDFAGTVVSTAYHGDRVRLRVRVAGAAGLLRVDDPAGRETAAGATVRLRVVPERVALLRPRATRGDSA